MILNDQGGSVMDIQEDVTATLRAQDHGHPPVVCFEPGIAKREGAESRFVVDRCGTLRADMGDNQPAVCYAIEGNVVDRVSRKNGKGWCEDVSPTLNTQDRHAVVFALEGNGARPSHMGKGFSDDGTMYTMNTIEQHSVCYSVDCRSLKVNEELSPTLQAKETGGWSLNYLAPVMYEKEKTCKPRIYAVENHPNDSRARIDPDGIVQTLSSRMGTGGNNTPFVLIKNDGRQVINSSGEGITATIDASYYKGQGLRQGIEKEYVVIIDEGIPGDHWSVMRQQPSWKLYRTGCVQQYASGNQEK